MIGSQALIRLLARRTGVRHPARRRRRRPGPAGAVSSGSSSGRRKRSTCGYRACRSAGCSSRTEQPVITTRSAGLASLQPRQVTHPADDLLLRRLADRAGVDDDRARPIPGCQPRRNLPPASAPAISSLSEWFIWQPSVQTWNRGSATSSVANSARAVGNVRRAAGTLAGRRRAPAACAWSSGQFSPRCAVSRARLDAPSRPRAQPSAARGTYVVRMRLGVVMPCRHGSHCPPWRPCPARPRAASIVVTSRA